MAMSLFGGRTVQDAFKPAGRVDIIVDGSRSDALLEGLPLSWLGSSVGISVYWLTTLRQV